MLLLLMLLLLLLRLLDERDARRAQARRGARAVEDLVRREARDEGADEVAALGEEATCDRRLPVMRA